MKPWTTLAAAPEEEGTAMVLQERDGVFVIRVRGHELMSSARHQSEESLAELALERLNSPRPRVLIGGLGFGYTLRAALDRLPQQAQVVVAELSSAVVSWNRELLSKLAGAPLEDARVAVQVADVVQLVFRRPPRFDAILLDVDNGPAALSRPANRKLYGPAGLRALLEALNPGGVLAVWSSGHDERFEHRLRGAGFHAAARSVKAHHRGSASHVLFLARRPASG